MSVTKACQCCGKSFSVRPYRAEIAKYCSRSCLAKVHFPQFAEHRWKPMGKPPRKYKQMKIDGKEVRVHRYLMEQHLGRKLSRDEHVHHINGDPLDNRIENLMVLKNGDHQRLELSERVNVPKSCII
jgi:HNH endonuclease.